MKQARVFGICGLILFALAGAGWAATNEFKLGAGTGKPNADIPITLTIKSDQQVQGFVAAAEWTNTLPVGTLKVSALTSGAVLDGPPNADVVVKRSGYDAATKVGFFILGVVMDSDGVDSEIIPANLDPGTLVATATMKWELGPADVLPDTFTGATVSIKFVDGKYATSDLPSAVTLDNIVVVGGLSFGKAEGLNIDSVGQVTLQPPPPGVLTIGTASGYYGDTVTVPVTLDSKYAVQGFSIAVKHVAAEVTLVDIVPGAATGAAEFFQKGPAGVGTLGAIMDFYGTIGDVAPIPAGLHEVAQFKYTSVKRIVTKDDCTTADLTSALTFVDFELGDPLVENVIVVTGHSMNPDLVDGSVKFTVNKQVPPCYEKPIVTVDLSYKVGSCELEEGSTDQTDVPLEPKPIEITRGTAEKPTKFGVGLWYRSPEDGSADEWNQTDHIQGLSMALEFDPRCILCDGTFSLAGTVTETVQAEFVNVLCENAMDDGLDPKVEGQLIVGILVDALPPFDGRELPPTTDYLKLVCVDFHTNTGPNAGTCEECLQTQLVFPPFPDGVDVVDPVTGKETPIIRNIVSVRKQKTDPVTGAPVFDAEGNPVIDQVSVYPKLSDSTGTITMKSEPAFIRGDCNWSDGPSQTAHDQQSVDISDAAAVISFLFYTGTWQFIPPCLDACDANDDGRVDLADSVVILRYLFKFDATPKPPFPQPGTDPTSDRLTCDGGTACP